MRENRHGGDIYAEDLTGMPLDFSASINPLGMPERVRNAAKQAVINCIHYPDPYCRKLRAEIAVREGVMPEQVFCGNGAADILYRLLLAWKPKKILLPIPTFQEYEQAAILAGCEIVYFPLREKENFDFNINLWDAVTPDIDAVILCNPNNPTGRMIPKWLIEKGLETGVHLIIDECFQDFVSQPQQIALTKNVVLLRSFTKLYAMPGIRLGYCLSSDMKLLEKLYDMGAPWSVSVIAQECGIAAVQEIGFAEQTRAYISEQRSKLEYELQKLGFFVVPSTANFILFKNNLVPDLIYQLRKRGILLRSCKNFKGLDEHWIRTAVRTEAENLVLLHTLHEIIYKGKKDI